MGLKKLPDTRFCYALLMIVSVVLNWDLLIQLPSTPEYKTAKRTCKKENRAKFEEFESLVSSLSTKKELDGARAVLAPVCVALHHQEGDCTPIETVLPIFAVVHLSAQSPCDEVKETFDASDLQLVVDEIADRWLGKGRKVGLRNNAHCLAYMLSLYAQRIVFEAIGEPTFKAVGRSFTESQELDCIKQWCNGDEALHALLVKEYQNYKAGRGIFACKEAIVGPASRSYFNRLARSLGVLLI